MKHSILAIALALSTAAACDRGPTAPPPGPAIPGFALTRHDGTTFERSALDGEVWLVDFMFTSCEMECPAQTSRLKSIADAHPDPDLRLLSISIDPDHDTPERLVEYAGHHRADLDRWSFVTGEREAIGALARDGFGIAVAIDGRGPLAHSSRFVLLDRQARVRGAYESKDPPSLERLERHLAAVLAEPTA